MADLTGGTTAHRVVVTAGHVDHGKSTLVRALTGMEPDRLSEERRRGLTIDLGFAWTDLATSRHPDGPRLAFIDVPGHERFVPTMLAGAGAAPVALPVVAADGGWSQQTTEHRDALDLLGVPAVAIVVTRAGLADEFRLAEVTDEILGEVAGTSLDGAPLVVTDALTGRGLDELRDVLRARLAVLAPPADEGRPRLWVDRSFVVPGAGTVVTGTVTQGTFASGDEVRVLPADRGARIRRLQALGEEAAHAGPGTRVALNLAGIDHTEVARGDVVVAGTPWRVTREVDLAVRVLPGRTLGRTGAWHLHVGSARTTCRVRPWHGAMDGPTDGVVRVLLDQPLPLVAGDRVVLRDAGPRITVAGGVVADPSPRPRPRGADARRRVQGALRAVAAAESATQRLGLLLGLRAGADEESLLRAAAGLSASTPTPADVHEVGSWLVADTTLQSWREVVRGLGAGTHDGRAIAAALESHGAAPRVAGQVADHLVAGGDLVRVQSGYALPEHADAASDERTRLADAVVEALLSDPFQPPDLDAVAREHGLDHRGVAALVGSGAVVRCGKVAFARRAVDDAAARLRELAASGDGTFTASQARETWGTTRRYAIPLLEHLDRTGVTEFDGQLRRLR